jgi:hypothetical protein
MATASKTNQIREIPIHPIRQVVDVQIKPEVDLLSINLRIRDKVLNQPVYQSPRLGK